MLTIRKEGILPCRLLDAAVIICGSPSYWYGAFRSPCPSLPTYRRSGGGRLVGAAHSPTCCLVIGGTSSCRYGSATCVFGRCSSSPRVGDLCCSKSLLYASVESVSSRSEPSSRTSGTGFGCSKAFPGTPRSVDGRPSCLPSTLSTAIRCEAIRCPLRAWTACRLCV